MFGKVQSCHAPRYEWCKIVSKETLQVSTSLLQLNGWKLKTPNIFVKWGSWSQLMAKINLILEHLLLFSVHFWSVLLDCSAFVIFVGNIVWSLPCAGWSCPRDFNNPRIHACILRPHSLLLRSAFYQLNPRACLVKSLVCWWKHLEPPNFLDPNHNFPWFTPYFSGWNLHFSRATPRHRVRRQRRNIQLRHLAGLHWKTGPHLGAGGVVAGEDHFPMDILGSIYIYIQVANSWIYEWIANGC